MASVIVPEAIVIRTPSAEFRLNETAALQRAAMHWTYVVRNRERWAGLPDAAKKQAGRARALLLDLGLTEEAFESIARYGVAEIAIPYRTEKDGWEARIFPWEYTLAAATRDARRGHTLTVLRSLRKKGSESQDVEPTRVLYIESAVGKLREIYSFETERELVKSNLRLEWKELSTPTLETLEATVASFQPHIIHVTGFDSHQGYQLLRGERGSEPSLESDGYLLIDDAGNPTPIAARKLAEALCCGKQKPRLVGFSIWNSAARIAPLTIAAGAGAAIGFQDTFEDDLAEMFFGTFYRTWRRGKWDLAEAFRNTWETIRAQDRGMQGTGLVLWGSKPLVVAEDEKSGARTVEAVRRISRETLPVWMPDDIPAARAHEVLKTNVKPCPELNYSLLHNGDPLFEHFTLINASVDYDGKDQLAVLPDVNVTVRLSAGAEMASYERIVTLDTTSRDLKEVVHVPLTSGLMRSVHESINSSLFIEISWGKRTLYRDSHLVRLVPVDQWRDNDRDGKWLPSFVLPRDPAVTDLIDKAQRAVRLLRDDPSAGFDGYQSVDPNAEDPSLDVDRQVQAIWATIVEEFGLGYINPPPTYDHALDSQRLRTPSAIVRYHAGTCIDLALLFASCLELVDIYPVVFLLKGHAFPGYWRREEPRDQFMEMSDGIGDVPTESDAKTSVPGAQRVPWWFRKSAYDEIVKQVMLGNLVPLESVWLTEHSGFWDAVDGGRANFKPKREFHSMLDIARAREAHVTPLPIWEER